MRVLVRVPDLLGVTDGVLDLLGVTDGVIDIDGVTLTLGVAETEGVKLTLGVTLGIGASLPDRSKEMEPALALFTNVKLPAPFVFDNVIGIKNKY